MTDPYVQRLRDIEDERERRQEFMRRLLVLQDYALPMVLFMALTVAALTAPTPTTAILVIVAVGCGVVGFILLLLSRLLGREIHRARISLADAVWVEGLTSTSAPKCPRGAL